MVSLKRISRRRLLSLSLGGASMLTLSGAMGSEEADKRAQERPRCVIML